MPSRATTDITPGKAMVWQLASKVINVGVQLAITMVLARLLTPDEFGTVAIVSVFTAFFSMLADVGIGPAIVQFDDLGEREFGSLLTFTALVGVALVGLFCLAAGPVAGFYRMPDLEHLCRVASLSVLFTSLNMVPNGVMLRRREFRLIAVRTVVATLASGCMAVALALAGIGCLALVLQSVIQSIVVFVWNELGTKIRPRLAGIAEAVRRIFRYSAFQALFSFINYFSGNLDNLLIGRYLGAEQLGYYDKAYKLNGYPIGFLSGVVGSTLQPFLVAHKDKPDAMYARYLEVAKPLTLFGAWLSALLSVAAPEVVELCYGSQWLPSAPVLALLSLSLAAQMLNSIAGPVLQSLGRTDYMLYSCLVNTLITVSGIVAGIASGSIVSLALYVAAAKTLHLVMNTWLLVGRGLRQDVWGYLRLFVPEVLVVVVCRVAGQALPPWSSPLVPSILLKASVVTVVSAGVYGLFSQRRWLSGAMRRVLG